MYNMRNKYSKKSAVQTYYVIQYEGIIFLRIGSKQSPFRRGKYSQTNLRSIFKKNHGFHSDRTKNRDSDK